LSLARPIDSDHAKEKQAALAGWEKRLKTITKPKGKAAKVAASK